MKHLTMKHHIIAVVALLVTSLAVQGAGQKTGLNTSVSGSAYPAWSVALGTAGRLSVQALDVDYWRGVHRAACRIHRCRHLVSVVGGRWQPVFPLDRWRGQRPLFRFGRGECDNRSRHDPGDDPLKLSVINQGVFRSSPRPYEGRYPCGSLVYNGIWYYGTYCLHPSWREIRDEIPYNWPWLGPFPGFRWSKILVRPGRDPLHASQTALR